MKRLTDEKRVELVDKLAESCIDSDGKVPFYDRHLVHAPEMTQEHILDPGVTLDFASAYWQNQFVTLAKRLYATSTGEHRAEGKRGAVKPDYIPPKRLPWLLDNDGDKVYPLHVSDTVLEVLARAKNLKKIADFYKPEEEVSPYAGTQGHRVVDIAPGIRKKGKPGAAR